MSAYAGVVLLDALYLGVGAAVLAGLGIARTLKAAALHAGLALVVGWALIGTAASLLLIAGLGAVVWQILVAAVIVTGAALMLARRVPARRTRRLRNAAGWQTWIAVAGAAALVVYLEALFWRSRFAEPTAWDAWAFWVPKAKSIVYFGGLDTSAGGFTSFANPDYPPFAPAAESLVFRFAGGVRTDVLPLQHWILVAGFFGALAVLLGRRVPPWILWPSLTLLALMPGFTRLVGSSLADEPLAMLVTLAGICAALWLLEDDARLAVLAGIFLVAGTLLKNEGLLYALLIAILLAVVARGHRAVVPGALAAAAVIAIVPWKLWLSANDVPRTALYDPADLLRPGYLADRSGRLWTAVRDVPGYFFSWDAWLVAVPLALLLALALVGVRPSLSAFVLGTIVVGLAGNLTVYWVSREPIDWYISTTADRTSATLAVFSAAVVPLLAAEALRPRRMRAG